ncbi:MAG TPA: cytochrome b/b6 domain-containing protein [Terracidiphilus sp.]|nr:cytochrome b/b6 domain-containing protein [Terracidiphilus sp.]
MAHSTYIPEVALAANQAEKAPRPPLLVRFTHWTFTLSFFGLAVSGFAIILSHPHFYWGETGNILTPPLFSLPLPTMLGGPSGWGRAMHFQSAWLSVLSGLLYIVSGVLSQHFRRELLPAPADLSWNSLRRSVFDHLRAKDVATGEGYNILQRLSYLGIVFVVFPMTILSGFAMSPSITSVYPWMVEFFGGHQTARTIHFFLSDLLVLFLLVHVTMVVLAGFTLRMRSMITGRTAARRETR